MTTQGFFAIEDVSPRTVVGRGFPCTGPPFQTSAFANPNGKRLWRRPAAEDFPSSHGGDALATGSARTGVVLSRTANRLDGVDASTGHVRWSVPATPTPFAVTNSRTVVTASTTGTFQTGLASQVRGLDRATGKELWTVSDPGSDRPSAAADNKTVVAIFIHQDGSTPPHTRALDPRTGAVRWERDAADATPAGSVVALLNASRTGPSSLSIVDAMTGEELWSRPGDSMGVFPMGTRLGVLDGDGLHVLDARSGQIVWERQGTRPIANDARLVAIASGRTITLLDARTGTPSGHIIKLPGGYEGINTLVVAGHTLYAGLGCSPNAD